MRLAAVLLCLFLLLANYILYQLHIRKFKITGVDRDSYKLSWPTRLFKYLQYPFYFATLIHIFLQSFVFSQYPPDMVQFLGAAFIGLSGTFLLYKSLKAMSANFMPCFSGILPEKKVEHGPYKYFGHPIYLSNIFQFLAVLLILPGYILLISFILLLWIYYYTIKDENRSLKEKFPHVQTSFKDKFRKTFTTTLSLIIIALIYLFWVFSRVVPFEAAEKPCQSPHDSYHCVLVKDFNLSVYQNNSKQFKEKTPVLILHGGPGFSSALMFNYFKFIEQERNIYLYDQRGSGYSEIKKDLSYYNYQNILDEVEAFRKNIIKSDKIIVIGHSFGAYLALSYALKYNSHIDQAILISTPIPKPGIAQIIKLLSLGIAPNDQKEANIWMSNHLPEYFKDAFFSKAAFIDFKPEAVSYAVMIAASNSMLQNLFKMEDLKQIHQPVLITYGFKEILNVLEEDQKSLHQNIANSQLVKMNQSGHWMFMEEPEKFKSMVLEFLDKKGKK